MSTSTYMTRKLDSHTWYGLPVAITVASNHSHRVEIPGLAIPHPGVVNWIIRQGMPDETRLALTARHELGHLQTLPIPLLHLLLLLWPRPGRPVGPRWLRLLVGLLAHQAVWELAAEGYVRVIEGQTVNEAQTPPARRLYAGFWSALAVISIFGSLFLLRRRRQS